MKRLTLRFCLTLSLALASFSCKPPASADSAVESAGLKGKAKAKAKPKVKAPPKKVVKAPVKKGKAPIGLSRANSGSKSNGVTCNTLGAPRGAECKSTEECACGYECSAETMHLPTGECEIPGIANPSETTGETHMCANSFDACSADYQCTGWSGGGSGIPGRCEEGCCKYETPERPETPEPTPGPCSCTPPFLTGEDPEGECEQIEFYNQCLERSEGACRYQTSMSCPVGE